MPKWTVKVKALEEDTWKDPTVCDRSEVPYPEITLRSLGWIWLILGRKKTSQKLRPKGVLIADISDLAWSCQPSTEDSGRWLMSPWLEGLVRGWRLLFSKIESESRWWEADDGSTFENLWRLLWLTNLSSNSWKMLLLLSCFHEQTSAIVWASKFSRWGKKNSIPCSFPSKEKNNRSVCLQWIWAYDEGIQKR